MGEDNYNSDGKISSFNEAAYRVKRFDELQRLIFGSLLNLTGWDETVKKYEYEKVIIIILIILNQNLGKMSTDDKKKYLDYTEKGLTYCDTLPVKVKERIVGIKTVDVEYINRDNLSKIRGLIMEMLNFTQEVMERTGYSSPNEEKEGGYD